MTLLKRLWRNDRTRHALIAAMLAAVLGAIEFFEPLRPMQWQLQAGIAPRQPSGEIVFIEQEEASNDEATAHSREELAELINGLTAAGAYKIVLGEVFDRPATPEADEALRQAIARSGRTVLAQHYLSTIAGERARVSLPQIVGAAPEAIRHQRLSPFGFVWLEPYSTVIDGTMFPSLPSAIAETSGAGRSKFHIDYSINDGSIPWFTVREATAALSVGKGAQLFGGKTLLVAKGGFITGDALSIPGAQRVPRSIITILASETLKIGPPTAVGWFPPWLLASASLLIGTLAMKRSRRRRAVYIAAAAGPIALLYAFAHLRIVADLATGVACIAIFVMLRLWHLRKRKSSMVDSLSGLPSFRRLEQDLADQSATRLPAVVIAKVHRFDEVLSSLSGEHHGEYVRLTADRLRIADEDLVIYSNGGRYLAWLQDVEDEEQLRAHLNGLRAILAHPLDIAGTIVDVGITFGADATSESNAGRKIAAAASAAERTTEAQFPVLLARESSEADRLWNVSLQAKIDQALKSGEIYVVYQPQFDLRSGAMFGAEALVRWNDRERGHISPSYFIEQCEQVGRMDALTEKVFHDAITSVVSSPLLHTNFQLSINISAIQLNDLRVAEMLGDVLSSSPFPTSRLTIEITETSRISDYANARLVMDQLRELGVRLSIDDFGVGTTSLETLLLLPFDELKIDRMFVSRLRDSRKARSIVESLVSLGLSLGISTIAEGVEDAETLAALKQLRCDAAQGYFLGRPKGLASLLNRDSGGASVAGR